MKLILVLFAALLVMVGFVAVLPVRAQESAKITDEHIAAIKNGCPTAIATLNQIHANDAPVYINRNQVYFSISDKLIARLNSRLALNRFDTSQLVKISSEYTDALTQFRSAYREYDNAMSDLIRINCVRQPVGFYDKVAEARELRGKVNAAIVKLHTEIGKYRSAVTSFATENATKLRSNAND